MNIQFPTTPTWRKTWECSDIEAEWRINAYAHYTIIGSGNDFSLVRSQTVIEASADTMLIVPLAKCSVKFQ